MADEQGALQDRDAAFACGREPLVHAITSFLAHAHAAQMPEIRASLERAIDEAGRSAIDGLSDRLARSGRDWSYYPGDPLARRIHHVLAPRVLRHEPVVSGLQHLTAVAAAPVVLVANHLSYSDANLVEVLLQKAGARELANRLTVVAGPKVYSNVRRRFSSLCFGTIKVPQSAARSSDEAVMTVRDVARAARRSIQIAHERLHQGDALLVFPEGNRSRSARMQPFLPGVARYLEPSEAWVLPMGIAGTHQLFPIDGDSLTPVPLALRIGRPVRADTLRERARGDRRRIVDCIGFAVADLLPVEYRGVYADEGQGSAHDRGARSLARELFL
jgi:1-acyl-sn-glycerol-3-phosphate acyltransferase